MPVFRFDKALGIARGVKAFLKPKAGAARGAVPEAGQHEEQAEDPKNARRPISEHEKKIKDKKRELRRIATELRAAKERGEGSERVEQMKRAKRKKQEIYQLEMELRAAQEERAEGEPVTGALPDFAVIGAAKCGTTFFYDLLARHPYVEHAAFKEPHYFDHLFEEEGEDWYRRCFPRPRWKDGRRTITGEATPGYLFHPLVPKRMARVTPQACLIALLRNPVDRTHSAYHHRVREGREKRTFEKAIEEAIIAQEEARPPSEEGEAPERGYPAGPGYDLRHGHLTNSIYVDHLVRWSRFFGREQMLVLKSEDFFERPSETLKPVLGFLGLPAWEPPTSVLGNKRNKGEYERGMAPVIRRRLENFFEPHNEKLYEYLGTDFGW